METESGRETIVREVHRALTYLYDPGTLRRSPLIRLLGVGAQPDPGTALQRALVEAIEGLRPAEGVPPTSSAWRAYRVLYYRFVEGFTQQQVAADLATSTRQLRRYERTALQLLADALRARYSAEEQAVELGEPETASAAPELAGQERELEWLRQTIPTEASDLTAMLRSVLATAAPLLRALGVRVADRVPSGLPRVAARAATLRQALLNVVTTAARYAQNGEIHVYTDGCPDVGALSLRLTVEASGPGKGRDMAAEPPQLDVAHELLALSGASLGAAPERTAGSDVLFAITVTLPLAERLPVLAIDDNADTLRLLERYLAGTRYRFTGVSDPQEGLRLAQREAPAAIILDVMMPGVDGWDVLGALREHPNTRGVPILVCTILPEEQLALTLGAAAFLRKPVSARALLSALDHLTGRAPGSDSGL